MTPLVARAAAGLLLAATPVAASRASPADPFLLETTADLVTVCQPMTGDRAQAAIGFCHGFVVGTYQLLQEISVARPSLRFFCLPTPPPTRTDAITAFVAWAAGRPAEQARLPAESIGSYLAATYPCSPGVNR